MARTADVVLMMLDATKPYVHRQLLEKELECVGIRLNKKKPNIYFKALIAYIHLLIKIIIFVIYCRSKKGEDYHLIRLAH